MKTQPQSRCRTCGAQLKRGYYHKHNKPGRPAWVWTWYAGASPAQPAKKEQS